MTRDDIANRARKVIVDHFAHTGHRPQPAEITEDSSLAEDCGADSLDSIEITMALEQEFDIEISDDDAEANKTFGAIVSWLTRRLAPDDDTETCLACAIAFKDGDRVLNDVSGGALHVACLGPERECYIDLETGKPIGPDETIPEGYIWKPWPQTAVAA